MSDTIKNAATANPLLKNSHAAFRYVIDIEEVSEAVFTECTLPTIEWEIESVKEGGLNSHYHQLPSRRKAAKLTLKNGVGSSDLLKWYIDTLEEKFGRRTITVKVLDSHLKPVMSWHIEEAYPTKWTGPTLKASDSSIAIQTLELACGKISVVPE